MAVPRRGTLQIGDRPPTNKDFNIPTYNIVTVHGIGNLRAHSTARPRWPKNEAPSWVTGLLPTHARCSHIMAFDYSDVDDCHGVSSGTIRALAAKLLDQLLPLLKVAGHIVFVAQDLGGLIVKEAISIAVGCKKYYSISGTTSLLIFFGTPHQASASSSWEDIAHWLMQLAGRGDSGIDWRATTSQMLYEVNNRFKPIENIYQAINVFYEQKGAANPLMRRALDSGSAKMGTLRETLIGRDASCGGLSNFSKNQDKNFTTLYKELRESRGPGIEYIQCLASLAELYVQDGFEKKRLISRENADIGSTALQQLEDHAMFRSWLRGTISCLRVEGNIEFDAPRLLSQAKRSDNDVAIHFRCDSKSGVRCGPTQLFASLCHQILRLRPQLFSDVAEIYRLYSRDTQWPSTWLQVLFSSLLRCGAEGKILCFVQHLHEMQNWAHVLDDLVALTCGEGQNFRLAITVGATDVNPERSQPSGAAISITAAKPSLETLIDAEIGVILARRPELSRFRDDLKKIMTTKFARKPEAPKLLGSSIAEMLRVCLVLFVSLSDPVTISSLNESVELIADEVEVMYHQILELIPQKHRYRVQNTLSWMLRAFRPLTVGELDVVTVLGQHREERRKLEDEVPVDLAGDILCYFGDLVQIASDKTVHMCNGFRNYISQQQSPASSHLGWLFVDDHAMIAQKCLEYISMQADRGVLEVSKAMGNNSDILLYAVQYWPNHYRVATSTFPLESDSKLGSATEFAIFFNDINLMRIWAQLYFDWRPLGMQCDSSHPLCVAVEVGCMELVTTLLKDPALSPDILTTALETAIKLGSEELVTILRNSGATSQRSLHLVGSSGFISLLPLFYGTKSDLLVEYSNESTPLHCACKRGDLPVVEELLRLGSDARLKSQSTGQNSLHVACQYGHHKVVECLLEHGVDPTDPDRMGLSSLHIACRWQQSGTASVLLSNQRAAQLIYLKTSNKDPATPLHLAAESGQVNIVKRLFRYLEHQSTEVDAQANIRNLLRQTNEKNWTALHLATAGGHCEVTRELLRIESKVDFTSVLSKDNEGRCPLHLAIENNCLDVVEQLLGPGQNVKDQINHESSGVNGAFPIHLAAQGCHFAILELLCKAHRQNNVSFEKYNGRSMSVLHVAVESGQSDIVEHLLQNGARADIYNSTLATPLLLACRRGISRMVVLLVRKGADVNLVDNKNCSPLLVAAGGGYDKIATYLLGMGAKMNAENNAGQSPALAAAHGGYYNTVRLLLSKGIDINWENRLGDTVMIVAAKSGDAGFFSSLLLQRPNLNAKDRSGRSLLMLAAERGHMAVATLLLDGGADPTAVDLGGRTALHFAAEGGQLNTVHLLLCRPEVEVDALDLHRCTPLHCATSAGSADTVRELLKKGASATTNSEDGKSPLDIAATEPLALTLLASINLDKLKRADQVINKALCQAAFKGHVEVIKYLERYKFQMGAVDDRGLSMFHLAAQGGHANVIELLLELKAVGLDPTDTGATRNPMSYASENGSLAAVQVLAEVVPEGVGVADKDGRTPLSYAAEFDHYAVVEYFLASQDFSIDVDKADGNGWTPLLHATAKGHLSTVQVLLRHKADPNIAAKQKGPTPLHLAATNGYVKLLDLLLDSGAMKDAKDDSGKTPMFCAAERGHRGVVTKLVDASADYKIADDSGWLVLHAAFRFPGVLEDILTKTQINVNCATSDGAIALHFAALDYLDSVEILLRHDADPLKQDLDGNTPIHLAAHHNADTTIMSLLLKKAKGPLTAKDGSGRTALMMAVESDAAHVARLLLATGQFNVVEADYETKSVLDVAMARDSYNVLFEILTTIDSGLPTDSIEKVLLWAATKDRDDLQSQAMEILRQRGLGSLTESTALYKVALDSDNTPLAEFLIEFGLDPKIRDEHGWSLEQTILAFQPLRRDTSRLDPDDAHLFPSGWDAAHSSKQIETTETDGLSSTSGIEPEDEDEVDRKSESNLDMSYNSWEKHDFKAFQSDHPVPLYRKFYFEINLQEGNRDRFAIGVRNKNRTEWDLRWWESEGREPQSDDGSIGPGRPFSRQSSDSELAYGDGDCVGCCIDSVLRKAYFTQNGIFIESSCLTYLEGRLFPVVVARPETKIVANFGRDLTAKPFKHPDGLTRRYEAKKWTYSEGADVARRSVFQKFKTKWLRDET